MPKVLQNFLASATKKAATDLTAVIDGLPEDKRLWRPLDKGRSAVDQAAECAVINRITVAILAKHVWPAEFMGMEGFQNARAALGDDWAVVKAELASSSEAVAASVLELTDDALSVSIATPWGEMTLTQIASYAYWNISYHEGQSTYISTLL